MVELTGKKYLVTGGAGFIGSHIAEAIVAQGKEVVLIDNLIAGKEENLKTWWKPNKCVLLKTDISDYDNLTNTNFKDNPLSNIDVVFNEAASKCTVCRENPYRDLITNAWGTHNICEYARRFGVKKIIHASTGSVKDGKPVSFYGVSKLTGESYLRAFNEYYPDFCFNVLRYYHVFGPRQDNGRYGGVIPIFIRKIMHDEPITIYGDGQQVRHFTWVGDVVKANLMAAESKDNTGTFNVVSDTRITINELANMLYVIMGKSSQIEYAPVKTGDIQEFKFDGAKFDMNYDNNFFDRLAETVEWYRGQL
ncbi:MAG: NAD-dependent epimerase/dehydratase family protein [Candidatus Omnitrophica bacterium]|nr:NAD-dependent epimerase/dehydratase family protein [Candidatus Omnitrophota bacterium]